MLLCFLFMMATSQVSAQQQTSDGTGDVPVYGTVSIIQEEIKAEGSDTVDTGDRNHTVVLIGALLLSGVWLLLYAKKAVNKQ